jgi:hypothetical protein
MSFDAWLTGLLFMPDKMFRIYIWCPAKGVWQRTYIWYLKRKLAKYKAKCRLMFGEEFEQYEAAQSR